MSSNKSQKGTLYLIPNTLGKTPENNTIPDYVLSVVRRLEVMIVENVQTTSRYLQWVENTVPEYEIEFLLLNKETPIQEIRSFLKPLKKGRDVGLISEAGCPAVADPGSQLIKMAHDIDIKVSPLVGPSSILLALMGSGFNGQQFSFHGYLPIDKNKRQAAIQKLETKSQKNGSTEIFMEAPHRNDAIKKDVIRYCQPQTRFCTATNLTLPNEQIISKKISDWRKEFGPSINKDPTIFLLYA
ncbi:16S rRNA (cytidine1402-2'-O)-methyltransferase [Fodinibius salinus]|uniref:16S rRNA (Cytidine1402-2'-O)-methyltransferase n=1 Tax=Fodinibius salinus TaxID=860790 RepID=A0A5D3YGB6_9BACT|nr:SAM-dependent methyltransferase [Fodinibius salinus]TYP92723.1 16S rRNA (cytidine1402-2'-O)-methyltransferase [Fodinibius salinus]